MSQAGAVAIFLLLLPLAGCGISTPLGATHDTLGDMSRAAGDFSAQRDEDTREDEAPR